MAKKFSKIPSDYTKKKSQFKDVETDASKSKKKVSPFSNKPIKPKQYDDEELSTSQKLGKKYRSEGRSFLEDEEPKRKFEPKQTNEFETKKSFEKRSYEKKSYGKDSYVKKSFGDKPYEKKPYAKKEFGDKPYEKKPYAKKEFGDKPYEKKPYAKKEFGDKPYEKKPYAKKEFGDKPHEKKPFVKKEFGDKPYEKKPYEKRTTEIGPQKSGTYKQYRETEKPRYKKDGTNDFFEKKEAKPFEGKKPVPKVEIATMPLNKYISHCGICSRRDAVELIKEGKVKVNNIVELSPGTKVSEHDQIMYEEKRVLPQKHMVYYLLNKPKDFITTTDDPEGRKTVLDLFKGIDNARIFPVGRLDRNTTGLLLLTNDGELAQRLAHPKHNTKKVYQVGLDKPLTKKDFEAIQEGLTLEDGKVEVDEVAYINLKDKTEIGIEIHIGRNRIVRRIFEHLGYEVKTLDRVIYAGLTKKNLPRGKWRTLEEKEVMYLKFFK